MKMAHKKRKIASEARNREIWLELKKNHRHTNDDDDSRDFGDLIDWLEDRINRN
jgi:hypothetical protein